MIEQLESRIAPAALITVNPTAKTAVWQDYDGDTVTLKWTTGEPQFSTQIPQFSSDPNGVIVAEIDLNAAADINDAITVTVKAGPHGDGHVDLGYVNATNTPLKSFTAPAASIAEIDAGDGVHAIGSLSVAGYGTVGPSEFASTGNDVGVLSGAVGSVLIKGDLIYGKLVLGANLGTPIGTVRIGGNLEGDVPVSTAVAGQLVLEGPAKSVSIGRAIFGGATDSNGSILADGPIKSLSVGGDLIGSSGTASGFLELDGNSPGAVVSIAGSLVGGSGFGSGSFEAGSVAKITVGGDLQGGSNAGTGSIEIGSAASISVKGSVVGGDVTTLPGFAPTGSITATANVGSIQIGRNLIAGITEGTSGQLGENGSIYVGGNLGSITVGGDVEGNNAFRAMITATGTTPAKAGNFDAIAKVTIRGSAEFAVIDSGAAEGIQAGGELGMAFNPDAGIGSVTIGGDFLHSSILAGTNDLDEIGAGRISGGVNEDTQSIGDPTRHAVLGTVIIKGALEDDIYSSGDSGFEAEIIGRIIVGGHQIYASGDGLKFLDPNDFVFAEEIPVT